MLAGTRNKTFNLGNEVERKHVQGASTSSKPYDRLADVIGTIGHDMIHSGELAEMRDFRNHLFHGVNSSSGALVIRDGGGKNCIDSRIK